MFCCTRKPQEHPDSYDLYGFIAGNVDFAQGNQLNNIWRIKFSWPASQLAVQPAGQPAGQPAEGCLSI